ncbi:unnamed protein product, partial [Polarella glacialis]
MEVSGAMTAFHRTRNPPSSQPVVDLDLASLDQDSLLLLFSGGGTGGIRMSGYNPVYSGQC